MSRLAPQLESGCGTYLKSLETDGLVELPNLLSPIQLQTMQSSVESRLRHVRFNDVDGFERTEPFRHMVQDVLTLDQGFVDIALHPLVKDILADYIGNDFALCEAKGWKSLATSKNFHGWHGDAWYDQSQVNWIPREVKLALYLTDVKTGAFQYVRGSHRKIQPRNFRQDELTERPCRRHHQDDRSGWDRVSFRHVWYASPKYADIGATTSDLPQLSSANDSATAGRYRLLPLSPVDSQCCVSRKP